MGCEAIRTFLPRSAGQTVLTVLTVLARLDVKREIVTCEDASSTPGSRSKAMFVSQTECDI
jgi:hypothetical protein